MGHHLDPSWLGLERWRGLGGSGWGVMLEELPYDRWEPTKTTLQLWSQIVGKIALRSSALRNHWWNVTLRPTARGVRTERLSAGGREFDIELDFVDHRAIVRSGDA